MKRLYRKKKGRILGGVCAGLAEYLGVDVSIVRLVTALIALSFGSGILLYLLAWIIIPEEENSGEVSSQEGEKKADDKTLKILLGVFLIILGIGFFAEYTFNFSFFHLFWPTLFILFGVWVIVKSLN